MIVLSSSTIHTFFKQILLQKDQQRGLSREIDQVSFNFLSLQVISLGLNIAIV